MRIGREGDLSDVQLIQEAAQQTLREIDPTTTVAYAFGTFVMLIEELARVRSRMQEHKIGIVT